MMNYHAEVINVSLKDKSMLKKYPILDIKKRFLGFIKIYMLSIPEDEIEHATVAFQKNLSTALKKEWYITFHTAEQVIVVFREKIFRMSGKGIKPISQKRLDTAYAEDKEKWNELIAYAKSVGVPDEQCDFLPEDFVNEDYSCNAKRK